MSVVPRRTLLAGLGAAAISAVPGVAEAKPGKPHGKPGRTHSMAFSDGVGLRDYRIIVGPQPVVGAAAWPSASNTPSVSGSTLTYYPNFPSSSASSTTTLTSSSGDLTTSSNGQIIQDKEITGSVVINHNNVIIRRCWIHNWSIAAVYAADGAFTTGNPAIVEDCLISAPTSGAGATAILNSNLTVRRCRIRDAENGFDLGHDVSIQDCFIYPLYNGSAGGGDGAHADGIQTQSGGPAANITVRHNTIFCRGPDDLAVEVDGTSCMIMALGTTTFTNVTVDNNFMAGGAVALYGPQSTTGTNVRVTDNHFGTNFHSTVGVFGVWTDVEDEAVVSGNMKVDASDTFISNYP